jgi:hypothetical protein
MQKAVEVIVKICETAGEIGFVGGSAPSGLSGSCIWAVGWHPRLLMLAPSGLGWPAVTEPVEVTGG